MRVCKCQWFDTDTILYQLVHACLHTYADNKEIPFGLWSESEHLETKAEVKWLCFWLAKRSYTISEDL